MSRECFARFYNLVMPRDVTSLKVGHSGHCHIAGSIVDQFRTVENV